MEDQHQMTHLFYRIYWMKGSNGYSSESNNIYHLDLSTNIDTVFLYAGGFSQPVFNSDEYIFDFDFWNHDPSKFIYTGAGCGMDCAGYVERFDSDYLGLHEFFFGENSQINISHQDDSLLYSSAGNQILKSTDGGWNWSVVDSGNYYHFLSLSPFNDNILFALNQEGNLAKSEDGG